MTFSARAARGISTSVVVGAVVSAIVLMVAGILGVLLYRRHRRMRPKYMFEEPSMLEDKKGHSGTNGTTGTTGARTPTSPHVLPRHALVCACITCKPCTMGSKVGPRTSCVYRASMRVRAACERHALQIRTRLSCFHEHACGRKHKAVLRVAFTSYQGSPCTQ